jgi:hypothetical protein
MAIETLSLEKMKEKYAPVLNEIQRDNVRLTHMHIQDGKFFLQGVAPSQEAKNKVWAVWLDPGPARGSKAAH